MVEPTAVKTLAVQLDAPDPAVVAEAARVLREGGLVAFPTDTVYGLAVAAGNAAAKERLYEVKGRPAHQPCAYLLPDREALTAHVPALPPIAARLADRWWPGPLTLVVPDAEGQLTGLRLPGDGLSRSLARATGEPLLQTSANLAGRPPATDGASVAQALGGQIDLLLDAGQTPNRLASTVVEVNAERWSLLREGALSVAEVRSAACDTYLSVCSGNICRSPLADALLAKETAALLGCEPSDLEARGYRFLSAGIIAVDGITVTPEADTAGQEVGVDLRDHRSRRVSAGVLAETTCAYGMDRGHIEFLTSSFRERPDDLQLLDPDGGDIRDPYGKSLRMYRRVAKKIQQACARRAAEIVAARGGPAGDARETEGS